MKKIMLITAALIISSNASADILLNGIGFDANELCVSGSKLVATVTKSRKTFRDNSQGDSIVTGTKTVNAGDSFEYRAATAFRDNSQGDSIPVHFNRNGNPVVIDRKVTGSDANEEVTIVKTAIPSC